MHEELQIVIFLLIFFGAPGALLFLAFRSSKRAGKIGSPAAQKPKIVVDHDAYATWFKCLTPSQQGTEDFFLLMFPGWLRDWRLIARGFWKYEDTE